jgi:ABC-2 type transport system permease protein
VSTFFGVVRHEFMMSLRRPGLWVAYILLGLFYGIARFAPSIDGSSDMIRPDRIWPEAGSIVFTFNVFLPLLAGILSADRMRRDLHTGVRELQQSTPLSIPVYILAKYLGVLASVLTPVFLLLVLVGSLMVTGGLAPVGFLWPFLLAFLTITVPAHAFVVAFSLACPLVIPLRVYQVLFTGYWFWGNLLSPTAFPTISDTLLNAAGQYPLQAYFGYNFGPPGQQASGFSPAEARLNLFVLAACIIAVLFSLDRYLRWQARRA